MTTSRELRDKGIERAEAAEDDAWKAMAYNSGLALARSGRPFSIDDITEVVGLPRRSNATGGIIMRLSRQGLIQRVGVTPSRRLETHAHTNPLWQGVPGSAGFGTGIGGSFQPPSGRSVDLVPAETKPSSTPPSAKPQFGDMNLIREMRR